MRVLLIKPDFPKVHYFGPQTSALLPSLGLEYIAANINDIAEVKILDNRLKSNNLNEILRIIKDFHPNYVGISCNYSSQIFIAQKIAEIAKTNGTITVIGGWHPTLIPDETLDFESIDIVVRGEGEMTFRELIQNNSPVGVPGLSYKNDGKQIHNPDRELMDLKNSKLPNRCLRTEEAKKKYNFFGFPAEIIETSRGCPFNCNFCCIHQVYRQTYRNRSIPDILEELHSKKIRRLSSLVFIIDDNFIVNRKFVIKLCDAIIRSGLRKYFITQARVDTIVKHPEVFKKMADAGFIYLFLGLESFSDRTLKKMNKQTKFEDIKTAVKILHDLGYIVQGNLIIGANIDDTKEDLQSTIDIAKSLDLDIASFSLLTPFPGTTLMEQVLDQDILLTKDWSKFNWSTPLIKYPNLTSEDLIHYISKASKELRPFKDPKKIINRLIKTRGMDFHISRIFSIELYRLIPQMLDKVIKKFTHR